MAADVIALVLLIERRQSPLWKYLGDQQIN